MVDLMKSCDEEKHPSVLLQDPDAMKAVFAQAAGGDLEALVILVACCIRSNDKGLARAVIDVMLPFMIHSSGIEGFGLGLYYQYLRVGVCDEDPEIVGRDCEAIVGVLPDTTRSSPGLVLLRGDHE